jgi:hypothetical protein
VLGPTALRSPPGRASGERPRPPAAPARMRLPARSTVRYRRGLRLLAGRAGVDSGVPQSTPSRPARRWPSCCTNGPRQGRSGRVRPITTCVCWCSQTAIRILRRRLPSNGRLSPHEGNPTRSTATSGVGRRLPLMRPFPSGEHRLRPIGTRGSGHAWATPTACPCPRPADPVPTW